MWYNTLDFMSLLYPYFDNFPLYDRICALHVWARDASVLALRSTNTPSPSHCRVALYAPSKGLFSALYMMAQPCAVDTVVSAADPVLGSETFASLFAGIKKGTRK